MKVSTCQVLFITTSHKDDALLLLFHFQSIVHSRIYSHGKEKKSTESNYKGLFEGTAHVSCINLICMIGGRGYLPSLRVDFLNFLEEVKYRACAPGLCVAGIRTI